MKEATGELNMTVVTVVAIAAVAAFFYAFVWPNIQNSIKANTYCATAQCSDCQESGSSTKCKCVSPTPDENGEYWSGTCTFKNGSTGN
jgi:hypothetical protein